jgi:hypothetical protein
MAKMVSAVGQYRLPKPDKHGTKVVCGLLQRSLGLALHFNACAFANSPNSQNAQMRLYGLGFCAGLAAGVLAAGAG